MKTPLLILSLILVFSVLACGTTTVQPTLEPAPDISTSSVPAPSSTPQVDSVPQSESDPAQTISAPSGLRVVYIRGGDLWSWTEAGGSVQLTGTGDMSTARLSNDGQLLAFMRGHEIWTVRMDGTDARLLQTLDEEGAALWFAPNNSLLAVSTKDRINIIDLSDNASATILTYPAIPGDYYPEVVWSPDSSGFKTVIPPQSEAGRAELLFVFTDGTLASLAKFSMLPLTESAPYISPDGGYIIYVAKLDGNKVSLFLMDSSGAARPYGEPGDDLRTYGWLPDSKHFTYGEQSTQNAFLGSVEGPPTQFTRAYAPLIRWVDLESYLALDNGNLTLGVMNGGSVQIDSGVQDFDFIP